MEEFVVLQLTLGRVQFSRGTISTKFVYPQELVCDILNRDEIRTRTMSRGLLTLWLRQKRIRRAHTEGGMNNSLLSAKTSSHSLPVPSFPA